MRNPVSTTVTLVAIFCLCATLNGCSPRANTPASTDQLCISNMMSIWYLLRQWEGEKTHFPPKLSLLQLQTTNLMLFVCPGTGHKAGSAGTIDSWTDYIYFGNQSDIQDPRVAMLLSPPENHHGTNGYVLWEGGYVDRVTPATIRRLVSEPWCMVQHTPRNQIEMLSEEITANIPPRFRNTYTNVLHLKAQMSPTPRK